MLATFLSASIGFAQSDAKLKGLADKYWDITTERFPVYATSIGDYRFNDRLDDVSEPTRQRYKDTLNNLSLAVESIPADSLTASDRLTRELLARAILDSTLKIEAMQHLTPLEPLDGPHLQFPLILVSQPFRSEKDFQAYFSRLRAFRKQVTDHISNMRQGMTLGLVSPKVVIQKVIPQIRTHVVGDPKSSEFYSPAKKLPDLPEPSRAPLEAELRDIIAKDVIPAYLQLLAFVEDEYLPKTRETVGQSAVPGGAPIYELLANLSTTVRMKPDAIHELGLSEVARVRKEMAKIQSELKFEGSLDEFIAHMRTDPKRRFTTREELIAAADAILQRAKSRMPMLFNRLPKADCVMKEIESFRASASPVAYYNPMPEDGSRPGYYYINTYAPQERLRFTLEALTYHESVPGHHLQAALDQEHKDLPKFRKYGSYTAYIEGWALYTEKLGYEIGGYPTPDDRYGQLTFEMWRACRLVVDTGMHAKGWSRQQAIDFMAANTSLAPLDIESEIDRYISWPGQALAYKIGELRFLALRKEAETKLGAKFDLKRFHDALLEGGAMPIELLEKRMTDWIEAQAK